MDKTVLQKDLERSVVKEKIWSKNFVLICASNFFIFLGFQMTLPTIPLFVNQLGGNEQFVGFVVGIFTFSALLIRPIAGRTLESKGRGFIYLVGLVIFVLSVGSYSFAASILFLFAMRIVQGIGWGLSTTASGTIATDIIPVSRRGEGLGYFGISANIALAIGPPLGLVLVDAISFPMLFASCAALGMMSLILSSMIQYKKSKKKPEVTAVKWDFYEKTAVQPSILVFFITFTFGGIATFLPIYTLQQGIEGIQTYFFLYALALMLSRLFAGQLYDQKGHIAVYLPGATLILLAMLLLTWLPNSLVLFIAAFCYGLGFGTIQPALQAWAIERTPKDRRGMANATFFSSFDLGIGFGAILFGQIGFWFNYQSIYLTSAISVLLSMGYYLYILWRLKITSYEEE